MTPRCSLEQPTLTLPENVTNSEQVTGHGRAEGAGEGDGVVAGEPRLVDAACEHGAEHDDRGRGDLEGLGRPPRHDGLPDEPHPGELEQQRERHGRGKHAHGVAVQDRGGAGEGAEPHELEHLRARKTDQTPAARQLYGRCKYEEQAAEPRLARHHLRRGKARRVGELVRGGHRAIAGAACENLQGGYYPAATWRRGFDSGRLPIDHMLHALSSFRPARRGAQAPHDPSRRKEALPVGKTPTTGMKKPRDRDPVAWQKGGLRPEKSTRF